MMFIRKAETGDLAAAEMIYAAARAFMRKNGNPDQWRGGYPQPGLLREDLAKERLYVCVEKTQEGTAQEKTGRKPILAVFVFFIGEEPSYRVIENGAWQNHEPYGVIHRIAVSDAARGRRAAAFCLDWAASQTDNLRIDTHEKNIPMQRLIEKCGFQRSGIIHVEDGSPRIAYLKTAGAQGERNSGV